LSDAVFFGHHTFDPWETEIMQALNKPSEHLVTTRTYSTDHIYLTCFLMCRGLELLGTETDASGRVHFFFPQSEELHSATAAFLADGQVAARQFCFTLLKLKKYIPR
jgi:hypothetical protein